MIVPLCQNNREGVAQLPRVSVSAHRAYVRLDTQAHITPHAMLVCVCAVDNVRRLLSRRTEGIGATAWCYWLLLSYVCLDRLVHPSWLSVFWAFSRLYF